MNSTVNFKKITELGKVFGWNFEEVGNQANIKRASWYNYKAGKTPIPFDAVVKVSEILDCSLNELITSKGETLIQDEVKEEVRETDHVYKALEKCLECKKKQKHIDMLFMNLEEKEQKLAEYKKKSEDCIKDPPKSKQRSA